MIYAQKGYTSPDLHCSNFVTCNVDGVYKPSKASLRELNVKFNYLRTSDDPIVLVFASCWSHYSPINTFLCARGLFSVLAMKKERSDLTIDRVFELDKEQQKYLKMLVDDPMTIKDLIIAGKYHLGFYAFVVFWFFNTAFYS